MLRRGLTHGVHKRATLVIILHAIDRYFCGIIYTRSIVSPIYNIENSMEACSPVPQRRTAGDQWRIGGGVRPHPSRCKPEFLVTVVLFL